MFGVIALEFMAEMVRELAMILIKCNTATNLEQSLIANFTTYLLGCRFLDVELISVSFKGT